MTDDPAIEALARSFLLGTARHPAAVETALAAIGIADATRVRGAKELTALAFIGQRLRYRRPGRPPDEATAKAVDDKWRIVPEAARPLMRRLVGKDGSASDVAALALVDSCHRLRLRPHPFDLPRLDAFVKQHGDRLGAYASAWAARGDKADETRGDYFDADAIDADNWTTARPAARAAFIAALRAHDAERARGLVEASFAHEPAPIRARLIGALAPGLSPADVPFLESLAKDRAPTVREQAQQLLKRIPGTPAAEGRLRELVARSKVAVGGLLRRRKSLALDLPANLGAADAGRRWAVDEYAGIGLDAMAGAFGLAVADMIEAASDDAALTALCARQATLERRFDVLAAITHDAPDAWIDATGTEDAVDVLDDQTCSRWCEAAILPQHWSALPSGHDLARLYGLLRRPLPQPQAFALLQSAAFAKIASAAPGAIDPLCVAIAALAPATLRSEFRTAFGARAPDDSARAILLLDCLAVLDQSAPEAP
jgi:hypothetical protein